MALTLAQLLAPVSADGWRSTAVGALQGLGVVLPGGAAAGGAQLGTGGLTLSGAPAAAYPKVVVKIVTAGELGAAVFQYSLDGGSTFSGNVTVPASPGLYVLGSTGVSITFVPGPSGGGTSFAVGDTFTFALNTPSLQVTAWQSGSGLRTLLEIEAAALGDLGTAQVTIAASGYLQAWLNPSSLGLSAPPPDAWLDQLASNVYQLTRQTAAATKGRATLTAAGGAGPYTVAAGSLYIADSAGRRYFNTSGGTLTLGGTLLLDWSAEAPGQAYNIALGSAMTIVAGALAGVTVALTDAGTGTWITSQGSDAESNVALATRCQARWPALSQRPTAAVYQLWALSAEAAAGHATTITKVLAQADPAIAGQVDVYLAGASGGAGVQAVTDANAYIQARVPLTTSAVVAAASNAAMTVGGTVSYYASKTTLAAVQAAVQANLAAYINGLGIGPDNAGSLKVYWTEIVAAIGSAFGVRNVASPTLNGGTTDPSLALGQVATLTNSLTFAAV